MKLFGYLLVACAGLGLFACNTEDEVPTIDTGKTQSVQLKLSGIAGSLTKAIEAGTGAVSTENIILKDLKVIFYENTGSGPIYRVENFGAVSTPADWALLTGPTGLVFHNLDPKVNAVLVIGNWQMGKDFTFTNVDAIKASNLLAAEENQVAAAETSTKSYVTLWGEDTSLASTTFTDTTHPTGAVITEKAADVTINPLVARFEIGNIQCTDLGTMYSSFDLKGLGLIDLSLNKSIGAVPGLSTRLVIDTHIVEPGFPAPPKYEFSVAPELAWAYNAIIPNVTISSSGTQYNPDGTTASPNGSKKFAYNFFPDPTGFPNIKLVLDNVMLKTGPESSFDYVVTAKFTSDPAHTIDVPSPTAGYIYKVDLAFKEENIGPWNPDNFICVIVKVTVTPWTIMALYPVFE